MRASLVAALALLALPAVAQSPPRLTPLGPTQAPRPSAPQLPTVQTPAPPPAGIQATPLPSLTAPDPAFAPPAATPVPATPAPPAPAPPAAAPPAVVTPATPPGAATPPVTTPIPPAAGTPIPGDWQARGFAELVALDKVTARPTQLAVKVGETVRFGTLAITVRACAVRPPDQPADATAFLEITDRGGATPIFRGWMFAAEPSLAVLEHPVYDVRVTGCRP
jgi:hypothetical protein